MPETESKITVQTKQHLQIHRHIQNPAKHLKWSKKERLTKTNYSLELFPKNIYDIFEIYNIINNILSNIFKILDRDVTTAKLSRVLNIPRL